MKIGLFLFDYKFDSNLNEASLRTAIGRSYFFSYLYIRNWAKLNGFTPANTAEDHQNIRFFLNKNKKRFVGDLLRKLRMLRNRADYNLSYIVDETKTEEALKIAKKIQDSL